MRFKKRAEPSLVEHESFHSSCHECHGGYGEPGDHNYCSGKCGHLGPYGGDIQERCEGPCACDCNRPLTKNELMALRRLAEAVS